MWSHLSYMEFIRTRGWPLPILLAHVIGLRLENFMIDVLHCVDLGIAAHILGNLLFILGRLMYGKKLNCYKSEFYCRNSKNIKNIVEIQRAPSRYFCEV